MVYKTSLLKDDTSTDNSNGYKIEILKYGTNTEKLDGYEIEMLDLMLIHLYESNWELTQP